MFFKEPVLVLGLRPGDLSLVPEARDMLSSAALVVGGRRLLDACPHVWCPEAERLAVTSPLSAVLETVRSVAESGRRVVVLADGDPLFFGIGKALARELGRENLRVLPSLTTVQLAAARLGVSWERTAFVSLHGRSDYTPLFAALVHSDTIAVFTDHDNGPAEVARAMLERGADGFLMTVLEDIGTEQEQVRQLGLQETWGMEFSALNIVFLEREYPPELTLHLGIPDHFYLHQRGLITKLPVRAAGLSLLGVEPCSVVWDLGAGCGSVAIEASHLARTGHVYAVERDKTRAAMIRENQRRTGAWMVEVVHGTMPDCLAPLPDPDRIFIGGGLGGESNQGAGLLQTACDRLKSGGRMVLHCILLDTLLEARASMEKQGWQFGVTQLQANASDRLAGDLRFKAQNPVFILWAKKP
ncbi:precorrin-6y C5,15-methyltransferase (decarboxylating) subunit CbiE [Pseudodesulfovibrio senegalensis]|jgi:precorrin-6Y C5,15-methyltransferase (decarboxylating)|uniref:Precorrin-6y C5,15-methyltransferase (Decarboxylating) subunit CbiE n=1 Tax=Pseudodesulfovibrio senegalensis TaxID=1721087 RepID=A0A6N6N486_9BACT|nr:precorrin-6y C5,15-methyltransferase (decarboxylating) subunit CbiE [Pseudodesulfovibrio senegalensis]KAB1442972.1 precorrin-6y C5,15-methyltransferase (decarboxylating) subunit CbiE [Pseudodesulfovibrio senegalensis]